MKILLCLRKKKKILFPVKKYCKSACSIERMSSEVVSDLFHMCVNIDASTPRHGVLVDILI